MNGTETKPEILVGLVGDNPAHVLAVHRLMRPRHTLLVGTARTMAKAEVLRNLLGGRVTLVELHDPGAIEPIQSTLRKAFEQVYEARRQGSVVLDITGGTKPMAIGAWFVVQDLQDVTMVYSDPSGLVRDAVTGTLLSGSPPPMTPEDFLALNHSTLTDSWWRGVGVGQLPEHMADRAPLSRDLWTRFPRIKHLLTVNLPFGKVKMPKGKPLPIPRAFDLRRDMLHEPEGSGYFTQNRWLEEALLVETLDLLDSLGEADVQVVAGAKVRKAVEEGNSIDEMDLVLVRGLRVVVVEAKARHGAKGAGAQLHKRVEKAHNFFGSQARVVFVHPAWGAAPPRDLVDLVGRRATLVGSEPEAYRDALVMGLGL